MNAYTVTNCNGVYELRLPDGRTGTFRSEADADSEGQRLTSGVLRMAIPRAPFRDQEHAANLSRADLLADALPPQAQYCVSCGARTPYATARYRGTLQ